MAIIKTGNWGAARLVLGVRQMVKINPAITQAVHQEAHYFRRKAVQAFNTSGVSNGITWAPNTPSTLERKRSSKPLIDRGDLRNSITVFADKNAAWVGVPNNVVGRGGQRLVSVAETHEFGRVIAITVTRKLLAYLHATSKGKGLSGSVNLGGLTMGNILLIEIPQRSFLQSTMDYHFKPADAKRRFLARVAKSMGGMYALLIKPPEAYMRGKR